MLLVPYSITAVSTLLVYDYLCTLCYEIEYIWSKPLSLGTLLFALNRYLPFIDTFVSLNLLTTVKTPETCLRHFKLVTWLIVLGTILAELILMLRTYALWERRRSVLITLGVVFLIVLVPSIVVTHLELESLIYVNAKDPTKPGCFLARASSIIYISYVLLMLSETVIATLTTIKAYQHLQRSRSRWVKQLYQEGILFYFYLLLLSIANVIVPVTAPASFANWLATPQRVIHSILCTRVLFSIFRRRARADRQHHRRRRQTHVPQEINASNHEIQTNTALEFTNGSNSAQMLTTIPFEEEDWGHDPGMRDDELFDDIRYMGSPEEQEEEWRGRRREWEGGVEMSDIPSAR